MIRPHRSLRPRPACRSEATAALWPRSLHHRQDAAQLDAGTGGGHRRSLRRNVGMAAQSALLLRVDRLVPRELWHAATPTYLSRMGDEAACSCGSRTSPRDSRQASRSCCSLQWTLGRTTPTRPSATATTVPSDASSDARRCGLEGLEGLEAVARHLPVDLARLRRQQDARRRRVRR